MLPRVRFRTFLAVGALLAAGGCARSTAGAGTVSAAPAGSSSSGPDFPATPGASSALSSALSSRAASSAPASSAAASGIHPVPSSPLRTVTVHGASGHTYVVKIWADVRNDSCFDHAHGGPIVTFLTEHPCRGLQRYLATTTVGGRPVGFNLSSTGFEGTTADPYVYAGQFAHLEEQDGTGSIDDLLAEGYRLPEGPTAVPASEAFDVLGQDQGVTIWDAWYLDGPTTPNAKPLMTMAQDLFLQF
jgi:hypothetical protein